MAKKIAFINQKGGVGKTTTTFQTAAYLTKLGYKVLMIDLDPQGNLTRTLQISTDDENTVAELLLSEATFEETVKATKYGDLIPSDDALGYREMEVGGKVARERLLSKALKDVEDKYDYILVDCPPAINTFTYNALVFACNVIIVAEVSYLSVSGIGKMLRSAEDISEVFDKNIKIRGVLLTKDNMTKVAQEIKTATLESMSENGVKVISSVIGTYPAVIAESIVMGESLFDYAPKSKATSQYEMAIKEIIEIISKEN